MFNMGLSELIVLGAIALLVIGPKQLPEVARNLARFINELKRTTGEFKKNFQGAEEIHKAVNEVKTAVGDTERWVRDKAQNLAEPVFTEEPMRFGHVDNPNHHIEGEEAAKKLTKEEPEHEGFAVPNKKTEKKNS